MTTSFTIGRSKGCDVILDQASVSRVHAELFQGKDGRWYLIDRHSNNGTFLLADDGQRAITQAYVKETDTVVFADIKMTVRDLLSRLPKRSQAGKPDGRAVGQEKEGPLQGGVKRDLASGAVVSDK